MSHPVDTLGAVRPEASTQATLPFDAVPASGRLVVADHGPDALAALLGTIAELQRDDPLTPVTVAVPTPIAGLALRRVLGARSGLVNVHFTALARVAELLGAPSLAATNRRPLTQALRLEAIHTVLARDAGPLAPVAQHPATAQAMAATFEELAAVAPARLDEIASRGERASAVVRCYRAFRALTTDCYDVDDILHAAADAVRGNVAVTAEVGHVVVYLPTELTVAEEALLHELAARDRLTVIAGRTGDEAVDAALTDALVTRLSAALGTPATRDATTTALPLAQRMISAPDPEDEVRAVARELAARAARGERLGRVALLYRVMEPYARMIPEVLDGAGIPWTGSAPRRIADAAAGRLLLGVLGLAGVGRPRRPTPEETPAASTNGAATELARDDVVGWLTSGPVLDPADGRRVNATRWDVISREAGVVRGATQWAERLALHRDAITADLAARNAEGDASEWQLRRLERVRDDTTALAAFVADLAVHLAPPAEPTWHAHSGWARQLLTRYAGSVGQRHDWPEREVEAVRAIETTLDELGGLDAMGGAVDVARFRRALEAELDTRLDRVGKFGAGVLVGTIGQAAAAELDVVYVLGAVEGVLPPRGREDPLLPDRDRRGIAALGQHRIRRLEERRDFLAALASATERVLTFPRADTRAQRKRLPARWVVESARSLAGADLTAEELRDHPTTPWLDVVESFDGLIARGEPGSDAEYRLRSLRGWHDAGRSLEEHPLAAGGLARGFAASRARRAAGVSEFAGFIGEHPELAPGDDRAASPTALQSWATCPFRYFLGRVLRLHEVPRPEATVTISALDEGALIHAVLEEFVRDSPQPDAPDTPWTSADRARLEQIVTKHCDDAEARGITGRRVAWTLARRRIVATARQFLVADEHVRAEYGVLPAPDGLERAFGSGAEPPVEIELGRGRRVRFRGRIDRVDRSPDGRRTVVYDYKTGSAKRYAALAADPVNAGRNLQLPVYALAARARDGGDEAIAAYWFTSNDPRAPLLTVALDNAEARFVDVVTTIVDGIAAGSFPAYPGDRSYDHRTMRESWDECRYCEFDRLCPVDRGTAWERIADDEAVAPFLALRLPEPSDEEPA